MPAHPEDDRTDPIECPGGAVLAAYNLGRLPSGELDEVAEHVAGCAACQAALEALHTQTDPFVRNLQHWLAYPRRAADAAPAPEPAPPAGEEGAAGVITFQGVKYQVLRQLGRGGMGVVYEVHDLNLNRTVALKTLRPEAPLQAERLARFRVEGTALARLDHPNVVRVYASGEQGGRPYLCMEFLDGGSLAARVARAPLEEREAAGLVETLARAVQHAHERGVLHRDLKPANVLFDAAGTPKVVDFGLARLLDADDRLTHTGAVLGSPAYVAPEQAAGATAQAADPAVDVFGLGAILYEALTGKPPFGAATRWETLAQGRAAAPLRPCRLRAGLSAELEAVCLKCLEQEPPRRYRTAQAVAEDLRRWLRRFPTNAGPRGPVARAWGLARRHPVACALALLGTAALLAAGLGAAEVVRRWGDDGQAWLDRLLQLQGHSLPAPVGQPVRKEFESRKRALPDPGCRAYGGPDPGWSKTPSTRIFHLPFSDSSSMSTEWSGPDALATRAMYLTGGPPGWEGTRCRE
jgi:predicted Ser/Thr protein kinase